MSPEMQQAMHVLVYHVESYMASESLKLDRTLSSLRKEMYAYVDERLASTWVPTPPKTPTKAPAKTPPTTTAAPVLVEPVAVEKGNAAAHEAGNAAAKAPGAAQSPQDYSTHSWPRILADVSSELGPHAIEEKEQNVPPKLYRHLEERLSILEAKASEVWASQLSIPEEAVRNHSQAMVSEPTSPPLVLMTSMDQQAMVKSDGHRSTVRSCSYNDVTPAMLDRGDMYTLQETVWDMCVFVGMDCLGWKVSLQIIFALLVNVIFHCAFCVIVLYYMLDSPVDNETLDSLLTFRMETAHSAQYADMFSQNSLAAQICQADGRVFLSSHQTAILQDIFKFEGGGPGLAMLAQVVWALLIMRELSTVAQQWTAIYTTPWGEVTELATERSEDFSKDYNFRILRLMPMVQVMAFSRIRAQVVLYVLVIPRIVLTVFLALAGCMLLSVTSGLSTLLVNAMFLGFVMDLSNIFYTVCIPRRAQCLLNNIQPLQTRPPKIDRWVHLPGMSSMLKVLTLVVYLIVVQEMLLTPFTWRLQQAKKILCSGEQNFIWAKNKASQVVHVARTTGDIDFNSGFLTPSVTAVLQAIQPELESKHGYEVPQFALDALNQVGPAYVLYTDDPGVNELASAPTSSSQFTTWVRIIGGMSLQDSSSTLVCKDHGTGLPPDAELAHLREMTGIDDLQGCSDSRLQPLCNTLHMVPVRSICPSACRCWVPDFPAFYPSTSSSGCPGPCEYLMAATIASDHASRPCEDLPAPDVPPLLGTWASGLVASLRSNENFREQADAASATMMGLGWLGGITEAERQQLVTHMVSGSEDFADSLSNNSFMPGLPHHRGLTGCDFLASYEVTSLLGRDLCNVGTHRSIRFICPQSCRCFKGAAECPGTCPQAPNNVCTDSNATNCSS